MAKKHYEEEDPEDVDSCKVHTALEAARAALAAETHESWDDFRVGVLGGEDLQARKGIPYDAIIGIARNDDATDWCKRRKVPYSFRANYTTYGASACGVLARFWCHKMQYYLNIEANHPEAEAL
eukprot:8166743-Lingulodinium_polyedra.AAC.1